jgi:hypothetical protein
MTSKTENVLQALATLIDDHTTAKFERNASVPEKIPEGGMIVLRDGNPGSPDTALGGFSEVYYEHEADIEFYYADGAQSSRDAGFDTLVMQVGTALESDPSLGGLISGMSYARPDVSVEIIPGADAIKLGTMPIVLEYEAPSSLS